MWLDQTCEDIPVAKHHSIAQPYAKFQIFQKYRTHDHEAKWYELHHMRKGEMSRAHQKTDGNDGFIDTWGDQHEGRPQMMWIDAWNYLRRKRTHIGNETEISAEEN